MKNFMVAEDISLCQSRLWCGFLSPSSCFRRSQQREIWRTPENNANEGDRSDMIFKGQNKIKNNVISRSKISIFPNACRLYLPGSGQDWYSQPILKWILKVQDPMKTHSDQILKIRNPMMTHFEEEGDLGVHCSEAILEVTVYEYWVNVVVVVSQ